MDKSKNQDQVQAIYLAQANIFAYEATKSTKSWVPLCDSTVPISILYDNTRSIYRIISVDAEIKEVVVNTTVIPELEFVKTTQKFGYWKDIASGRVFGIGFASEYEAEAFDECLRKVKQNIGPPSVNSCMSLISDTQENSSTSNNNNSNAKTEPPPQSYRPATLQGQGDGQTHHKLQTHITPYGTGGTLQQAKQLNWNDYEQIGPTVLQMMNSHNQGMTHIGASRPSTYKVDLPIIRTATAQQNSRAPTSNTPPKFYPNLEDLRLPAPPPYHVPFQYIPQQIRQQPPAESSGQNGNGSPLTMPLPMSIPQGYCYQGPQASSTTTGSSLTEQLFNMEHNPPKSNVMDLNNSDRRDFADEINRIKSENMKLSESLIESTCNAKKWELQVNSLREDNIQLVKSVAELNSKVDAANKDCRDLKEQANRWKEHYQQAVNSAKEKGQHLKDCEDKLKYASADKARIENVLKDLQDELKRQQENYKEQSANHVGQYTNKYFKELEEHYRKLLSDSQKRIEEVLRKDNDRKNVLRGVDTLFTGAIQGLINIHGQIRQAYEQ
ncbi:Homer protein 2 [Orchesella cincta]|uniref:Homer protein 2 n=1 Tax=Orchesella cincta TaxID=48709 RepID=A0A1D2M5G1_ORCCI|nr:Homer protein 2 [Orchesella cincta]